MTIRPLACGAPQPRLRHLILIGLGSSLAGAPALAETPGLYSWQTLDFGSDDTFLTGIRGDNIVGNYTIPGSTETGGLYYSLATGIWSPFPEATANGANFPGAIGSSPYGPSFGTPSGILRAVGSYQTTTSAPYDLSYLYDGAAAAGQTLLTLAYPGSDTLFTIAHSNFGNQVVGDYDSRLATGNAFIYTIDSGTYTTNNIPGAISTTAYGVYGDRIAGGYGTVSPETGLSFEHGYVYDQTTGTYATYDHPGAIETHFEGITGAGRSGEYNLVANWTSLDGVEHPAVMHLAADGSTTWYEIDIPGATVSANSAYGDHVVGIYVTDTRINGYLATIPGMYNPIRNDGSLSSSLPDTAVLSGSQGDDIVNNGTVSASGAGAVGLRGETYGVVDNTGTVVATGTDGAAVDMHGRYGALLNSGTLRAGPTSDALRTASDSLGTVIVNSGIIDGRIAAIGAAGRFENSGWIGVSGDGVPITDQVVGTFVQTAAGTLAVRVTDAGHDGLAVDGTARVAGTLAATFETRNLRQSYAVVGTTAGVSGTFASFTTAGLSDMFAAELAYAPTSVTIAVSSALAGQSGNTASATGVGAAIDGLVNTTDDGTLAALPDALSPLYALTASEIPGALAALSGEGYASEQTVLAGDSLYSRQAVLGRLRQGLRDGEAGSLGVLASGGPALAAPTPKGTGATLWGQAFGGWSNLDGKGNTAAVSESIGGVISGVDMRVDRWLVGAALGYSQSNADIGGLGTQFTNDSLLVALYAGTNAGPWAMRFGASYAFNQLEGNRTISYPGYLALANASSNGGTTQAFGEIGYDVAFHNVALEPFAGLAYVNVAAQDIEESGASAGLFGSSEAIGVGYSTLGLRAATTLQVAGGMVLQPRAALAWQYAFGDTTPNAQFGFLAAPGAGFSVSGVPIAENTALVELGADLLVNPKTKLGLTYAGQFASGVSDNAVQASFSWSF